VQYEIKNRFTGSVIFSLETESLKLCVEAAWKSGADLSGADLSGANISRANISGADLSGANISRANISGANISGANISRANLSGADLYGANISGANISGADLSGANISGANISGANISRADLSGADLSGANISRANISRANLSGADISRANISGANLSGAKGIDKSRCTPLLMLLDQPGKIRAYKLVNAELEGIYNGGVKYLTGTTVSVDNANMDDTLQCAAGINIATLDWCMKDWREGYRILIVEFTAKDIAAIPTATDGKIRLHRCKVVGEKDLVEIGLKGR